jgi:hypothetical protein
MERDPFSGEQFARVVGRRTRAPIGVPPGPETRAALAQMARYVTRAPKGVFIYRSHEEANADRDRWTVDAIVATQRMHDRDRADRHLSGERVRRG